MAGPTEMPKTVVQSRWSLLKWATVVSHLGICCFLYGFSTTVAIAVQRPIVQRFGTADMLAWIGLGPSLGSVAIVPTIWCFIASLVIFEVGSTLCGAAPSMTVLVVGRVITGLGGIGVYQGCLTYISAHAQPSRRSLYIAMCGVAWAIGCIIGTIAGGSFADGQASFSWAFYINACIGAALLPGLLLCMGPLQHSTTILPFFDLVGTILYMANWTLFACAFTLSGQSFPWSDQRSIGLLTAFGVTVALAASRRLFSLVKRQTTSLANHTTILRFRITLFVATACAMMAMFVPLYYIPLYFEFVAQESALSAALRTLPFVLVLIGILMGSAVLLNKIAYCTPIYQLGGILIIIGGALLTFDPNFSRPQIYGFSVIAAVGIGITAQTGHAAVTAFSQAHETASRIAMQNIAQFGGVVVALVIAGQIFRGVAVDELSTTLHDQGANATQIAMAEAGLQELLTGTIPTGIDPAFLLAAVGAIEVGIRRCFVLLLVAGAIMLLASTFMPYDRVFTGAGPSQEGTDQGASTQDLVVADTIKS